MPAQWEKVPVLILKEDIRSVQLATEEVATIESYCDRYFPKAMVDAGKWIYPSARGLNKPNPNARGIRGEFAGAKHFLPDITDIDSFLADRPWKMRDMGDAIILGKREAKIFDFKTRARRASAERLVWNDDYMAELDAKFLDQDRYGYLQCFLFCASDLDKNIVHLMGWMSIEEFADVAQLVPTGQPVPQAGMPYGNDTLLVPYRRLHPIAELEQMQYCPITLDITMDMRNDWERSKSKGIDGKQYIQRYESL